jgi:hypothetical protein
MRSKQTLGIGGWLVGALFVVGCQGEKTTPQGPKATSKGDPEASRGHAGRQPGAGKPARRAARQRGAPTAAASGGGSTHLARGLRPKSRIKGAVLPHKIKADLSNVSNLKDFKKLLAPRARKLLAKNGFAVQPTDYIQMFFLYENNEYHRPNPLPAFITTDTMLHTYHLVFDYALRKLEAEKLYAVAVALTEAMLKATRKQLKKAPNRRVKAAARRNLAFFAVADALLRKAGPGQKGRVAKLPAAVRAMVKKDLGRIYAHKARALSAVTGAKLDFTLFAVRGHYNKSKKLKRYFRALTWYGVVGFPLPQTGEKWGVGPTLQALLMVQALRRGRGEVKWSKSNSGRDRHSGAARSRPRARKTGPQKALALWETIYEPTTFFVGKADDYTVHAYGKVAEKIFGKQLSLGALGSRAKLKRFVAAARKLPPPQIANFILGGGIPTNRQFRFMGQRFIPDSRILQELTHPKVDRRYFPTGLDVVAAMGSKRALALLKKHKKIGAHPGYTTQLKKMRREMNAVKRATWKSNLYWGWLWTLGSLLLDVPAKYPSFMQNQAWKDKSIYTYLGSWSELRHDTILYAKPSAAECGDGGEQVKPPKGYVEPNVPFWTRLEWLGKETIRGLAARGILSRRLKDRLRWVVEWTEFCRRIAVKQLTGKRILDREYNKMRYFGAELEALFTALAEGQIMTELERDMAVIADIHTSSGTALEVGVGRAAAIYVIVPLGKKLQLTRGATFTHYEFKQPASQRLTDKKWRLRLKAGKAPPLPAWIKSFFIAKDAKLPPQKYDNYMGGC